MNRPDCQACSDVLLSRFGFGSGSSKLQVTAQGLRKLGSGTVDAGGSKGPGVALGVTGLIATANPAGLIVSSGMKVYGEKSCILNIC